MAAPQALSSSGWAGPVFVSLLNALALANILHLQNTAIINTLNTEDTGITTVA